jgi:hypothetical protein
MSPNQVALPGGESLHRYDEEEEEYREDCEAFGGARLEVVGQHLVWAIDGS